MKRGEQTVKELHAPIRLAALSIEMVHVMKRFKELVMTSSVDVAIDMLEDAKNKIVEIIKKVENKS